MMLESSVPGIFPQNESFSIRIIFALKKNELKRVFSRYFLGPPGMHVGLTLD